MSDLIRKSDVIKLINCFVFSLYKEQDDKIKKVFKEYVEKMPAAYSVDGVVKELEQLADTSNDHMYERYFDEKEDGIREAIEIVKQGCLSDDVCEWKYKHPFGDFPSCKNVNSISRDRNWKFCPYCGKKIKVVE